MVVGESSAMVVGGVAAAGAIVVVVAGAAVEVVVGAVVVVVFGIRERTEVRPPNPATAAPTSPAETVVLRSTLSGVQAAVRTKPTIMLAINGLRLTADRAVEAPRCERKPLEGSSMRSV